MSPHFQYRAFLSQPQRFRFDNLSSLTPFDIGNGCAFVNAAGTSTGTGTGTGTTGASEL
jgi:hypothetical protein